MDEAEKAETARWRALDRHAQDLSDVRQIRAQAVIDIAEDCRQVAATRGTDPLDDLLELYSSVSRDGAKCLVADAVRYLRAESNLLPARSLRKGTGTLTYLGRAERPAA